ncbi:MAG TPA: lipoprotein-releasing system ATP-binding protein LolD [Gammaproteobacteria bacterium]|nr:lipoprotein-releasing system ATP-binding protein LolD [Gammaproteobacteria bacterium]
MSSAESVLSCVDLYKRYDEGPTPVEVLRGVNLEIKSQEQVAIVGSSGSGKTTLLNLLGGLDFASSGYVTVAGQELSVLGEVERGRLRNAYLGFVYQFHHLLREFTALENVCMPLLIGGLKGSEASVRAAAMLNKVGLSPRVGHKPAQLSGGERQRVAIARALVTEPRCVLLDEPTGNLDRHTALDIQQLMTDLNQQLGISFVIVTHDEVLADSLDRKLILEDGQLVG